MKESIQPYINKKMLVLKENSAAEVAARAMHERHVGCAVVSDRHGQLVGIVTDRDLSTQILGFQLPSNTPISEVMTVDIISVDASTSLTDVAKTMEVNGIRRIPIIEKDGSGRQKCLGIVTLDDLIASESVSAHQLSQIVKTQVFRSAKLGYPKHKDDGHKEQTYNRFSKSLASAMKVPKETAEKMGLQLLKNLVQRLPYTGAAQFITQLPALIQEDLLSLPAGPNLKINEVTIVKDFMAAFQLDHFVSQKIIKDFWAGLEVVTNSEILQNVLGRLPEEMRVLLTDTRKKKGLIPDQYFVTQECFEVHVQ